MMETDIKKYRKNIKVYIKVLPPLNPCWEEVKILDDQKTLYVRSQQDFGKGKINVLPHYWVYNTDGIINKIQQQDIFETLFKESIKQATMGIDLLLFAYGQTGSGKSTTINGLLNTFDDRGLVPRIITELFVLKDEYKYEYKIEYSLSYVEIYKTYIIDLLKYNNARIHNPYKLLEIINMESEDEGLKLLFEGEANKNINLNNTYYSNLATSVFTVYIKCVSKLISNPVEKYSKIHIVDMAGIDTSGNLTCRFKTAKNIGIANLNKSQLEQCLMLIQDDLVNKRKKDSIKDTGVLVEYLGKSLKAQSIIK